MTRKAQAPVGMVVEGGQRALNTAHGSVVDGSARKFLQKKQALNQQSLIGTVPQLVAGGIAGATEPLVRLTILFQVSFLSEI